MKAYQRYKNTSIKWAGKLPFDWALLPLKHSAQINQQILREQTNDEYKFYYIDIGNVNHQGIIASPKRMRFKDAPSRARRIVQKKDTIISTVRTYLKAVAYINDDTNILIASTGFATLTPKNSTFPKFLYYLVLSQGFVDTVSAHSVGVSYPAITSSEIGRISVFLPPLPEQRAIATFLDRKTAQIDTLIAKKQHLIKLLQEQRTALINQAVTKGLDPDAPTKDSGFKWLGEIPRGWRAGKLKHFAVINPTKNLALISKETEDLVTFLPMERVNADGTYDTSLKRPVNELWSVFTYFEKEDVIIAKITPCFENGKGAFLQNLDGEIGFGSTEFHVFRAIPERTIALFLYYLTQTHLFKITGETLMHGAAGQKRIPTSFVKDFPFGCPPIHEQEIIVNFLNLKTHKIDGLIQQAKKQIQHYIEYRTILISAAVTGKIDVRE